MPRAPTQYIMHVFTQVHVKDSGAPHPLQHSPQVHNLSRYLFNINVVFPPNFSSEKVTVYPDLPEEGKIETCCSLLIRSAELIILVGGEKV